LDEKEVHKADNTPDFWDSGFRDSNLLHRATVSVSGQLGQGIKNEFHGFLRKIFYR